jgi:hypothetical protein
LTSSPSSGRLELSAAKRSQEKETSLPEEGDPKTPSRSRKFLNIALNFILRTFKWVLFKLADLLVGGLLYEYLLKPELIKSWDKLYQIFIFITSDTTPYITVTYGSFANSLRRLLMPLVGF